MTTPTVGNSIYYNGKDGIMSEVITKVGRKYFYSRKHDWGNPKQWTLDTLEDVKSWGSHNTCHLSRQSLDDLNEKNQIAGELSERFGYDTRLTLDQLRRIKAIVDEGTS